VEPSPQIQIIPNVVEEEEEYSIFEKISKPQLEEEIKASEFLPK
jgi:hypothetical protein